MNDNIEQLIYVCDDDNSICELIKMYLENDGFLVDVFHNGEELMAGLNKKTPALITLDIMLSGHNGYEILNEIRKKNDVPVILVSAKDTEVDKVKGFNEGTDDYIVKPFMPLELVARVKAVLKRYGKNDNKPKTTNKTLKFSNIKIDTKAMETYVSNNKIQLTQIEYKFLLYMMENPNTAITKKDILMNVWGYTEDDNRVIDDLLKRFRKKLQDNNAKVKIETIWGVGYRLIDE